MRSIGVLTYILSLGLCMPSAAVAQTVNLTPPPRPKDPASQDGTQSGEEDVELGYQAEAAVVTNSVWRGAALWTPGFSPGLVGFGELRAEGLGAFDLVAGIWAATPLDFVRQRATARQSVWVVPSLSATGWLTDRLYVDGGYSVYLESGAQRADYQHDFALGLGYQITLAHGLDLTFSSGTNADPIRRRGVYVHGDALLELVRGSWSSSLALELGASRYHGEDAVPWGLQALMATCAIRRSLPRTAYVELKGVIAYSQQTGVWHEGPLNQALNLAVGFER